MDFFGIIYDMKNGKKLPYSKTYFDTLFAAKLGGSDVKTLTGALPLTFTTSETALRSWTLHGAHVRNTWRHIRYSFPTNIKTGAAGAADSWTITGNAEGVGERTKNLLEITAQTQTINGVTYTINDDGTVTVSGTATAESNILLNNISGLPQGNYILSGEKNDSTTTVYPYVRGGGETTKGDATGSGVDFSMGNYTECKLYVTRNFSGTVTVKPMIRLANTSPEFIPYGYCVPLTISQTGQTDKNYEIFVGSSPLGAGQTVSDTQTIELFEGEQIVDIPLTNQPRLSIQVFSYYGIADNSNSGYVVRLEVTHNGSTIPVNVPVPTSMDEGDTVADVIPIPTEIGENTISLNWDEYPPTTMTIKYKE